MPLIPLVLLIGLLFVPNRAMTVQDDKAALAKKVDRKKVQTAMKEIKKKLAEKKAKAMTGLEDAKLKIENMERHFDELANAKNDKEKKQALTKLNDIKKQLADKRKSMGDKNKLKESLNKLKDVNEGPAKQLAEALSEGDMKEAQKAIKNLADKLKNGKLSETEKKKLAKDMKQMAEQLVKMADKHKKAKQELKEKIKQAQQNGDLNKAQKLQEKLEKMESQNKQMEKMKKMAEKMQECSDCMKQGNGQPKMGKDGKPKPGQQGGNQPSQKQMEDAAQALEDLAEDMQEMQKTLEDMEDLEDLEDAIDRAKNAGNGMDDGMDGGKKRAWNDFARGKGRGHGERDKEKGDSGGYKTGVKGLIQRGETVVTGHADGNNITGKSLTEARSMVQESLGKDSDPLENVKLPKSKREQAKQYFDKRRKGG